MTAKVRERLFSGPKKEKGRHTITFQVGGSAPWYAHYYGGKLEDNTGGPQRLNPSRPNSSPEIKPETKDSEPEKEKDKQDVPNE